MSQTRSPIDRDQSTTADLRQRAELVTQLTPLYITLAEATKILPPGRNGRPTNISTILRWIVDGTVSPAGERVRLQAVRMGGRWLTTRQWLDHYARRLTPTFGEAESPVRTTATRTREAARAARELDRIGI